ncbi:MAG: GntR family transcriptional regulator, partial [Anaerovoracaceae bacterium]
MAVTVKNLSGVKTTAVSLSTDLSIRLKEDILSGRLKKDRKLTEQAICDEYKVSRTPVREALVQLEMEGLVESIPNRGAFVVGLSPQDKEDILTLRKIYEIQATRWAIERITDEEMEELEENFDFMEFYTMKKDIDKMLNINQIFHQMIYKSSHNRML